ncbi:hypothetical protein [Bradyrhizobium neotropicale]|uniref:Uncharacterized protein n=1 Tax=Bradyrhizobium neotropicale TaxID=1497615 RepID=A0A176ZCB3_9BRAD|nr:hypothetical protein [Bradyrhizobium neotropicale]OAF17834.1 hypothetical protein AXW67_06860 [Bradyrhizobium neotropicale]
MLKKIFLTLSFLLPLVALTASAQAGSTISDKSYWPNEARSSTPYAGFAQNRVGSAFAYDRGPSVATPATAAIEDRSRSRYHGGPKSQ